MFYDINVVKNHQVLIVAVFFLQIGSLSVNTTYEGKIQLVVSQPGGLYVILYPTEETETKVNK